MQKIVQVVQVRPETRLLIHPGASSEEGRQNPTERSTRQSAAQLLSTHNHHFFAMQVLLLHDVKRTRHEDPHDREARQLYQVAK